MGAVANRCPPPDDLEGLLAERCSGPERDALEAHVEHCSACQEWLDRRVGTPSAFSAFQSGGGPIAGTLEPDPAFLERLERLPPREAVPAPRILPAADWLESGRLGQYEILGKLGQGGMGAVYKARHVELDKVVALKVLPTDRLHETNVARFKREMRAVGQLEHPNIVAAHDAGQIQGVHYLVMALVDGVDLGRLVKARGPLRVADACALACQAAAGLQHAAERGLVHRDVKPSNFMLARDGLVKLLDLGLARSPGEAPAEALTATGVLLGTADYLAPEQWDSPHAADTRADIYSLGCTLYHLLTGDPPFTGAAYDSLLTKMWAHHEQPPPPVTQVRPDAPPALAAVIDRMLAKDPAARFATPAEVAEALRPFAAGADLAALLTGEATAGPYATATPEPARWETRPDPVNGLRRKPVTRRRAALALALAGLGLALVGLSWPLWPGGRSAGDPEKGAPTRPELHVTQYEKRGTVLVGDLETSTVPVRLNDDIRLAADLPAPAYCYLIAFNPDGTDQLCWPAGKNGEGDPAARPEARRRVVFPADDNVFVLDATGLQAFVLAVSKKPLAPYGEWKKGAGAIPWKAAPNGGERRWKFDGQEFARLHEKRGRIESKDDAIGPPQPLRDLCEYFKGRPEFESIRVVAFPVVDASK